VRIAIVSRIYRPEPSAASLWLGAVVDALRARGHEVEVLTARAPESAAPTAGERVRTFPVIRDRNGYVRGYLPYLSFDLPLAVRLLALRRKPDVVLVEPPPTTGAVVRVVCALRRIPYVYDAADVWSDAAELATSSRLVIRVLRAVERFALNGARHIVTISRGVADRLSELSVRAPVAVTGYGAETSTFRPEIVARTPLFLYAGSYTALHGATILVPAFADFLASHPGYEMRFVGLGTERDAIEDVARDLSIAGSVTFHEPVSPGKLSALLNTATASLATQLPGTGYEYAFTSKAYSSLAAGCPVIFAGPGPTAPFLDEANRHVRAGAAVPYRAEDIAGAMRALADAPLSDAERASVARWVGEEHSMDAVTRRVVDVLESV
jgi:glycosyltransferase involved in cell wall biosynthesis